MDFELLKAVSRSFYLSMVWLPPAMRRGIALGYMLARATDSVADTSSAAPGKRVQVLEQMGRAVAGALSGEELSSLLRALRGEMADAQSKESEALSLRRFDECLKQLELVSEAERILIRKVLSTIVEGQLWDLTYFTQRHAVETDDDTRRYTYMVAGCVGEFWTDLGLATMGEKFCEASRRELMVQAGIRYGQGLQLVNILRDMEEDADRGRSYICTDPVLWRNRAERYLHDGLDYARRLGAFRLRFTVMLPALLGLKTLRLIAQRTGCERVKITRKSVYLSIIRAAANSLFSRKSY